jgi:hypothetical protein
MTIDLRAELERLGFKRSPQKSEVYYKEEMLVVGRDLVIDQENRIRVYFIVKNYNANIGTFYTPIALIEKLKKMLKVNSIYDPKYMENELYKLGFTHVKEKNSWMLGKFVFSEERLEYEDYWVLRDTTHEYCLICSETGECYVFASLNKKRAIRRLKAMREAGEL